MTLVIYAHSKLGSNCFLMNTLPMIYLKVILLSKSTFELFLYPYLNFMIVIIFTFSFVGSCQVLTICDLFHYIRFFNEFDIKTRYVTMTTWNKTVNPVPYWFIYHIVNLLEKIYTNMYLNRNYLIHLIVCYLQ